MPTRSAHAEWNGAIDSGSGRMQFGGYEGPYSFRSRMQDGEGTNPEELIGAAHAGCFTMALTAALGRNGFNPQSVHTSARVHLEKQAEGFAITRIELETEARVPGVEPAKFQEIAEGAKKGCPVSKALAGTQITLQAKLVS